MAPQNRYTDVIQKVSTDLGRLLPDTRAQALRAGTGARNAPILARPRPQSNMQAVGPSFLKNLLGVTSQELNTGGPRPTDLSRLGGGIGGQRAAGMSFGRPVGQSRTGMGSFGSTPFAQMYGRQSLAVSDSPAAQASQASGGYTGVGDVSLARGLDGMQQHRAIMDQVSSESGVPWQILAAIGGLESGGANVGANGAGAMGIMQIVGDIWQGTANKYGGDLMNPYTNIRTAADILKQNYDTYGSWEKAAAAYFGGGGAFNDDGSYSTAADYYGTDIQTYVDVFKGNLSALGYGQPSSAEATYGPGAAATPAASNAVAIAMTAQGTPYVWGGESYEEGGFDCSGLVAWAYGQQGKNFGRTANDQYYGTARIRGDELLPGDLVFFSFPGSVTQDGQGGINHVAIYIGNGQLLQATSNGDVTKITPMDDAWYAQHIYGFGRVQ